MKTVLSFFILFSSMLFFSQEYTVYAQETTEEYSELYFMHGTQISKRFCYIGHPNNCEEGEVIESDTLKTSFLVLVTFQPDNPDSVFFEGLEGANSTPREMISDGFNGLAATYPNCSSSLSDCGYARKTGIDLELEFTTPSGSYSGTGTLDNGRMTLQAKYYYRGAGAEYILEGTKVEEEL